MSETPIVSVLMTAFNREKYIAEAIESVLASTFINFELIIVDDCSKDNTLNIANNYAAKDNRIKVYGNEQNLGDYHNRNQAAGFAKGKYIKYVDADDLIYPYGLEVMVKSMEKNPEAALGICDTLFINTKPHPFISQSVETIRNEFLGREILGSVGPTFTIFKKSEFEKLGKFTGKRYVGDAEMWFKFAANYPILILPPGLVWWRQHPGQEFQLGSNDYLFMRNDMKMSNLESVSTFFTSCELKIIKAKLRRLVCSTFVIILLKERKLKLSIQYRKYFKINFYEIFKALIPKINLRNN